MTRRLALSLPLIAAVLFAQAPADATGGMVDRYLTGLARQSWEERAAKIARIRRPAEVSERQAYIRTKVLEALGGFPERTPLNPRITGTLERDGYRVEKLIYESLPRFYVTASLYLPTSGAPPYPAVLGASGHSANGKAMETYQRVWISLAKRGFLVLAYDPPGQGERYEYFDLERGKPRFGSTTEHTMAGTQCLLTGINFARYELWDAVRGLDYLLTRPEVDPKRIGVAGNSGGGTQTAYLQVVEPRLAVAAPSCYITSWEKLWAGPGPQDAEQNFASFLKDGLDFGDFLMAFAPRPLKVLTAIRDFFPIDGARATFAEARRIYEVLGASDRIAFLEYDDQHGWSKPRREATYQWLQQWLNHASDEGTELDFATEPDANLYCTPTGQLATSLKGETVQSLNQALAEQVYPGRSAARTRDPARLRAIVAARIALTIPRGAPPVSQHGGEERPGYRLDNLTLETEPGISLPALVLTPGTGAASSPAVLYVNPVGRMAEAAPGGDLEALVKAGYLVLAPDLRGWGESGPPKKPDGYSSSYQTSMRAILVGRTMLGMRVGDLLRVFDYLAARPDVDPTRIAVLGKGNGGVVALVAAALEPRLRKIACQGAVLSYMEVVRAKLHENMIEIVVPGVLREFDLPDLAASIAPRPLWIVDPRTPAGAAISSEEALKTYPRAKHIRILERPAGRSFEETYSDWIRR
jgi:cephalosporin-C deacetylase-like acetyl esterase